LVDRKDATDPRRDLHQISDGDGWCRGPYALQLEALRTAMNRAYDHLYDRQQRLAELRDISRELAAEIASTQVQIEQAKREVRNSDAAYTTHLLGPATEIDAI